MYKVLTDFSSVYKYLLDFIYFLLTMLATSPEGTLRLIIQGMVICVHFGTWGTLYRVKVDAD